MNKYRNEPCQIGAEKYRSKREAKRHQELLLLEKAGHIHSLRREVSYQLAPGVVIQGRRRPAIRFFADFVYCETPGNGLVVEDCKGVRTTAYNLKRHLMKAIHNVDILET